MAAPEIRVGDGGVNPNVISVAPDALVELAGAPINPLLTIVAMREDGQDDLRYYVSEGRHGRTDTTLDIVVDLRSIALRDDVPLPARERIVIQAEDIPIDADSVSWETQADWRGIRLIPDLYYICAKGYEDMEPSSRRWDERSSTIIWRGSSTGILAQLAGDLDDLPRYRLSKLALLLGDRADVGITDVVQAAHPHEADLILSRLQRENLLRDFVPMADMERHRFIMDIGGNSNSWNFMAKLRLGCCVLRVESEWRQWFSDRLVAWEHYVPVASDLSDFIEKAQWCFEHPAETAAIAERGQAFAVGMKLADEMSRAAHATFAKSP